MKVVLEGLAKRFETRRRTVDAVRDVSLTVEEGEFLVLLGPSGCGKSTLLNLVAGLERPTAGRILFDDRTMAGAEERVFVPPGRRNVAMVFQNYALYPHMAVYANIAFPLRVARKEVGRIEEAVRDIARLLEIEELLDRRPGELSGGQRQRVAMARALVRRPDVFLLDEPLSNLDAQLRTSTRTQLKRLQEDLGVTTLYVTHDQIEAMTLGHRVALLKDGELVQTGEPEELYLRPATTFAATFIGAPPMNLLEGKLAGRRVHAAGTEFDLPDAPAQDSRPVQVGVRPEALALHEADGHDSTQPCFTGTVSTVEPLGREVLYRLDVRGAELLALHPERQFSLGDKARAEFPPQAVHLFDSEGRRL